MSLNALANHMAAQGRGPDSTLIHMSPREIQGLQALAQAHGRSMTINPQSGMPEAGILEDILPSIAGFAMNAFAPGSGAIASGLGSLLGGGSSGKATQSSPMGLASTSLERGLQAGFNTNTDIYEPSSKQISEKESPAGAFSAIQSSVNPAPPKDYLKDTKYNMYTAPAYSGYGATQHYDSGGMTVGPVGAPVDSKGNPIVIDPYDTRTDSQKAQDYLLGKPGAVNPFLFYHGAIPPEAKAALASSQLSALYPENVGSMGTRGGLSYEQRAERDDPNAWANLTSGEQASYYAEHPTMAAINQGMQNLFGYTGLGWLQNKLDPGIGIRANLISQGIDPRTGANMNLTAEQKAAALQAISNPEYNFGSDAIKNMVEQYKDYQGISPSNNITSVNAIKTDPNSYTDGFIHRFLNPPNSEFFNAMYHEGEANAPIEDKSVLSARSQAQAMNALAAQAQADAAARSENQAAKQAAVESNAQNAAIQESRSNYGGGYSGVGPGGYRNSLTDHTDNGDHSGSMAARGGLMDSHYAYGGGIAALAGGGMYNLGSYSDGGRLLRGPGDGVSDDIPATIGHNQPARLADGEFVVPARIVSELGNGSTEAGARKLYAMMDRVQKARSKTVGKDKVAANSRADKYLPI